MLKIEASEIPFEILDVEMVDIIKLLNCGYGIKTKFCCFGHREKDYLYIMFHEDMNENIEELAIYAAKHMKGIDFNFKYWIREVKTKVEKNWFCETNGYVKTESERHRILKEFTDVVNNFYQIK